VGVCQQGIEAKMYKGPGHVRRQGEIMPSGGENEEVSDKGNSSGKPPDIEARTNSTAGNAQKLREKWENPLLPGDPEIQEPLTYAGSTK